MSINSMNSRFAMAEKMSIPQIQQSIQAGSLPAYVGVPLLEEKMREQKKAAAMAQLAAAQQQAQQYGLPAEKPIAQGVMEQAAGIDSMPSNLPVAGYNDGGIVAFAEGGDADEDFDYEEFQDERDQSEYQDLLAAYMAEADAAGVAGIPINKTKKVEVGIEKKAEGGIIGLKNGGIPRFQSAGYVDANGISYTPEDVGVVSPEGSSLKQWWNETAKPYLRGEGTVYSKKDLYEPPVLSPVVVTAEPEAVTNEVDYSMNSQDGTGRLAGDINKPSTIVDAPVSKATTGNATAATSPAVRERPKSAFEDFIANIKEERAALNKQKQEDKYMALLTAGLGMMSGTSPNAFANIGQGAQAGVASYAASAKQRAAEKAALNKNLLMGQRYQSMEDIAARTADINEARYRDTLAARMAGSGDAASLKQERLFDQREAALARSIQQGQSTVANALKAEFGETGALTNKDEYNKRYKQLVNEYVTPYVVKRNQLDRQRFPDMFPSPSAGSGSGSVMSYVPGKGFVQN